MPGARTGKRIGWAAFGTLIALTGAVVGAGALDQIVPGKATIEGVTNYTRLSATMACAGATSASAVPELKAMGFKAIVNLRVADEEGARVDEEGRAAHAAGLAYFHLPFTTPSSPAEDRRALVTRFLEVVTDPANQPLFVHCAGGGRAAALWMIKRVRVDGWTVERAWDEALVAYAEPTSPALNWARQYAAAPR